VSACPHCAIDLPPRHELPTFTAEVLAERARLAMLDPEGEHDALVALQRRFDWTARAFEPERAGWLAGAVAPLDGVRARQILLHFAEQPTHLHIVEAGSSRDERDLLKRLGCDPGAAPAWSAAPPTRIGRPRSRGGSPTVRPCSTASPAARSMRSEARCESA